MNDKNVETHVFENKSISFKSFSNEFTSKLFKEFDLRAEKLGLKNKINDLFSGNKVNYTENLGAWHTIYRDQYRPDNTFIGKKQEIELQKLHDLCSDAKNIVIIGIGGSYEGPKILLEAININSAEANLIFITGSDYTEFKVKTESLDKSKTIFLVISKSFKTQEIILMLKDAISWSGEMHRFVAVTANKSAAKKYDIENIIEFDKEIGGRYSIWSEVSFLIYSLRKKDFDSFMAGGRQADIDLREDNEFLKFVKNLSYSDIWLHNYKNKNSRAVFSYIWNWRSFSDYVQQLEMESLGKQPLKNSKFKKTGQIIFGGYGPKAEHSYFQLLHQGTQDICVDIIAEASDEINNYSNLAAFQAITQARLLSGGTANKLKPEEQINGNVPTNLFLMKSESLYELGYLIATWEHRIFIASVMMEINPFDQFGVNVAKIYNKKYLSNKD